ncbi:MAG: IMP dehydrogenase [Patescibacteria group bacterium]
MAKTKRQEMKSTPFFRAMKRRYQGLAFPDVRLVPRYSKVIPSEACVTSRFSRNVDLQIPFASSAMDTVTGHDTAIVMAQEGGIGILHRGNSPERQAKGVARVKMYLHALIAAPITVFGDQTIAEIEAVRYQKRYGFQTFPVLNRDGRVIGLLTRNNFEMWKGSDLPAAKVMTKKLITAPPGTDLKTAYQIMRRTGKKVLPLLDAKRNPAGMYTFADVDRIVSGSHGNFNLDSAGHLRVGAAIGTGEAEVERALLLAQAGVDVIVIDTAHGDSDPVIEILKRLKKESGLKGIDIVAGNISTGAAAKRLARAGADGIKVGQGGGSICTTREISGIGIPQVTAVNDCARTIEGSGIPICSDGAIEFSGDIAVAIAAGAHCVMIGSLFAGTDEAPTKIVDFQGKRYKVYRGMGSLGAMADKENNETAEAARKRYGQTDTGKDRLVPEGIESLVPYRGPLNLVIHQLVVGLQRGMGYTGVPDIPTLRQKAEFIFYTAAGVRESHPHGVEYIKDAPNYHVERSY